MSDWTRPGDLKSRLQREWDRGRILAAEAAGESLFPLRIPLRHPGARELLAHFGEAREWIEDITGRSREKTGRGYDLEWQEVNHRQLGRNRLPVAAVFASAADALGFIGRQKDALRFRTLCRDILAAFPGLGPWLTRRPLAVLAHDDQWPRLLCVLRWLADHPRPGIYVRQLEIPGVDTKFIEGHKRVLGELLDAVLPGGAVDGAATGIAGFEQRYGFRTKPPQVRFRLLDPRLYIHGLSDLQIPADDFAGLTLDVRRVFITENEINGLSFPDVDGAMVVFGLGYGLDRLARARWLNAKKIHYWGDIDTHGFAMLDQMRAYFPRTRSLLMDRETLMANQDLWGREVSPMSRDLARLDAAESAVYEDLRSHRLAEALRLEQERVGYACLISALGALD